MRCDECLLERPGAEEMPLDAFQEALGACDECPLSTGEGALSAIRLLVGKQRMAARALRKLGNQARRAESDRREIEVEVARYEARIVALEGVQQAGMREAERLMIAMSAPILHVGEGVLAVPVIGAVGAERALVMTTRLLDEIQSTGARHAIIDLTGVDAIDVETADHLIRLVGAVRLLGARVILSGLRGKVAQAIVTLGVDLSAVPTARTMQAALRLCGA